MRAKKTVILFFMTASLIAAISVYAQSPAYDADSGKYDNEGASVEAGSLDNGYSLMRPDWEAWDDVEAPEDLQKNDDLNF